ncbi:MAG: efflux RND transporter permease subunit, partial [Bacteroidota bacterium]
MSQNKSFREFGISSWSIDNRITIFILTAVIVVAGLASFNSLPKENFPEIQWPVIFVSTIYPGTSAGDVENLVTRKIEKEIKGIKGIKEVNSTSIQDFSSIFVEFETDVDLDEAKREVEDAVNRSKSSLPNDLPNDPSVNDINLSEIPIMFLNVSGPFDNVTLKRYAEQLEEAIESELSNSILRVDLVGAPQREVQINVDLYKMEAASIALGDIEQAVSAENVIISGGEIDINNQKVSVRLNAEFTTISQLKNLVIRSGLGNSVYLQDIAEVKDTFRERESYARLNGDPVLTLNVIKKAGENLVDAADDIKVIVADYEQNKFPENLSVTVSVDQSIQTKNTLQELINTIIIGFILVVIVLMFFMGLRDALFVGLAVPLSSFIAFATLPALGFSMNLVVLFSFILAMGIVVDNAIVVIENTYRIFNEEGLPIVQAAKKAAGEVIGPVFSGTLTTVCPFLPLLFWPGPIGEFMSFMPVVMIITLFASLFVAYVINPVFATSFMKKEDPNKPTNHRNVIIYTAGAIAIGLICHLGGIPSFGTFMFFMAGFVLLNAYVLKYVIRWFQQRGIPSLKRGYRNLLAWSLDHTWAVFFGVVSVILVTVISIGVAGLKFIQFPEAEPNQVFVYNELPNGTDIEVTDSVTRILEERVFGVIGKDNPIVRSVVTNVAIGAGNSNSFDQSTAAPHKSKITVEFVGVKDRQDQSTLQYLIDIREAVQGIPGTKITVEQEASGPPGSADVELLVTSEDFDDLMKTSTDLFTFLDSVGIPGVEKLTWDVDEKRPELLINIDREKANQLGILSGQIGSALRTALFGKDISQFRDKEDEYDIILRLQEPYRDDISSLLNMSITFRDMSDGRLKSIPISSVASFSYDESYGGINRTDLKKSVKINSNVLKDEYNVNDVFADMEYWVGVFE